MGPGEQIILRCDCGREYPKPASNIVCPCNRILIVYEYDVRKPAPAPQPIRYIPADKSAA